VAKSVERDLLRVHPGIGLVEQKRATATLVESEAVSLLAQHRQADCPEAARLAERHRWSLHDFAEDVEAATNHAVLRSHLGVLQYVALRMGRVVTADPPACQTETLLQAPAQLVQQTPPVVPDRGNQVADTETGPGDDTNGTPEILDVKKDPLVKDCEELFHRTAQEVCKKDFKMEVFSAVVSVINGFTVDMTVALTGPAGKESMHYPTCAFQTTDPNDPSQKDRSLLEVEPLKLATEGDDSESIAEGEKTPEEKAGMEATLHLTVPLCSADSQSEKNGPGGIVKGEEGLLMELKTKRLGDLTQTKGYKHLRPPVALVESNGNEPSDYDLRSELWSCFPENGVEVVRNQGLCGSCWSFASATSTMHNLCSSSADSALATPDDRFEVAVQTFLSCNDNMAGCDGGMATDAASAIKKLGGIIKERDFPYKCGGGDPHNHFAQDSASCKFAPWGADCPYYSPTPGWKFYGVAGIDGEGPMKTVISEGNSLYVSFKVYHNFMDWKEGVYTTLGGGVAGGHAVAGIGYGTEGGLPYWLLQNSWGPGGSGVNGYVKFLRGSNLAGVEENAAHLIAWTEGGRLPTCRDGMNTGYNHGGAPIPCSAANDYKLCEKESVKTTCQQTCQACPGVDSPPPTPAPPPAPFAEGSSCVTATGAGGCTLTTNCGPGSYSVVFKCVMGGDTYDFSAGMPGVYTHDFTASGCETCTPIVSVNPA
jgi:cathepsin B